MADTPQQPKTKAAQPAPMPNNVVLALSDRAAQIVKSALEEYGPRDPATHEPEPWPTGNETGEVVTAIIAEIDSQTPKAKKS